MQGIQAVFEVSDTQLDALAGSEVLRTEVVTQGEHRASNKSLKQGMQRLIAALRQVGGRVAVIRGGLVRRGGVGPRDRNRTSASSRPYSD